MVSDQEIAKGVETVLRQSDPNSVTSHGVVSELESKLGLDLSHKTAFINEQINLHQLLRSHPTPAQPSPAAATAVRLQQRDPFALHPNPQFQQFPSHFALHPHPYQHLQQLHQQQQHHHHHQQQQQHVFHQDLNFSQPLPPPPSQRQVQPVAPTPVLQDAASATPPASKPSGKRRGGPGGLNKVCGVSPELEAIVGQPALPRTEIVKQLWVYIRKNNLQDPSNKRKIVCDDALRLVFETDCTDMFKMNKLLAKHIIPLEPTKESSKRVKVDVESTPENSKPGESLVAISESLAKFLGTAEREMTQLEASKRVWEYIKVNHLEDPVNSMVILCDAKLSELLGCESISAVGVDEMLARRHLFKQS